MSAAMIETIQTYKSVEGRGVVIATTNATQNVRAVVFGARTPCDGYACHLWRDSIDGTYHTDGSDFIGAELLYVTAAREEGGHASLSVITSRGRLVIGLDGCSDANHRHDITVATGREAFTSTL